MNETPSPYDVWAAEETPRSSRRRKRPLGATLQLTSPRKFTWTGRRYLIYCGGLGRKEWGRGLFYPETLLDIKDFTPLFEQHPFLAFYPLAVASVSPSFFVCADSAGIRARRASSESRK